MLASVEVVGIGAFLSGVGAVISSVYALRSVRRRADAECEKRLQALREGIKIGRDK